MNDAPKPSLWKRFTTSVKNFTSHAIGYFPRGVVLTGFVFAVSAALETYTGVGLGITNITNTGELLGRFAGHLMLGSAISGVLGATMGKCEPCKTGATNMVSSGNPLISKSEAQLGHSVAKAVTDHGFDALAHSSGLPTPAVPLVKNILKQTGLH